MHCYQADPGGQVREHNIDIDNMVLDVSFKPEKGVVMGKVTYNFTPIRSKIDSLYFDAPDIKFSAVKLDGKDVKYKN